MSVSIEVSVRCPHCDEVFYLSEAKSLDAAEAHIVAHLEVDDG